MSQKTSIRPVELKPRATVEEIKAGDVKPSEVQTVMVGKPKPIVTSVPSVSVVTPTADTSWLGESEAEKILDQDPYANPKVEIATPEYFQPIVNEEVSIVDKKDILDKLDEVETQLENTELSPEIKENVVQHLEEISQMNTPTITLDAPISVIPTQTENQEIKTNVAEDLPEYEEDLKTNVKEDLPVIPETYQPGMDSMSDTTNPEGPIIMESVESDEVIEDLHFDTMEEESPKPESYPAQPVDDLVDTPTLDTVDQETVDESADPNMTPEAEAPLIANFGFFREATKETTIPLQQEEMAYQLLEAFPNEDLDSPEVQRMKVNALRDPNTFSGHINRATSFLSNEQARQSELFKKLRGPLGQSKMIGGKRYGDAFTDKNHSRLSKSSTVIGGDKAVQTAMSLISGIRRLTLYNSGFNVVIRPPLLNELHQFFMRCRSTVQEFGRQFGQYSFLPADVELKSATMDLFEKLVLDSNLKDWKNPKALRQNISILDYEVLLWGMATLMFPEGTQTEMFCNKRDCGHVDIATIDVAKMRFNDYSKLSEDAIQYVCATGAEAVRSAEDLETYHTDIFNDRAELKINEEWTVSVEIPSIDRVISDGETYVSYMASKIQLKNGIDVADFLNTKYFRIFAPWISRLSYCDKKTGNYVHFKDPVKLPEIIEALQLDNKNVPLDQTIINFMNEKKVSHFGYLYSQCPKCNTKSDLAINGIIPCDMQYAFFTLTMDRIS